MPGHSVCSGQKGNENPQDGNEASKENNNAAMLAEKISSQHETLFRQPDFFAVLFQDAVAKMVTQQISEIIPHDGTSDRSQCDPLDMKVVRAASIQGGCDDDALCGKRQTHAFQHDRHANDAITILLEQMIEKLREVKQCRDPVEKMAEDKAAGYDTRTSDTG